jgi:hypothetical protein
MRFFVSLCLFLLMVSLSMAEEPPKKAEEALKQAPMVGGEYQITKEWQITLPAKFSQSFQKTADGVVMVLWHNGITCWIAAFDTMKDKTPAETLQWRKNGKPADATKEFEFLDKKPLRYGYVRLENKEEGKQTFGLYTYTFGKSGHLQMVIVFERAQDIDFAQKLWESVKETPVKEAATPAPK